MKKNLCFFALFFALIFVIGCGGSSNSSESSACNYGSYKCRGDDSYFCGYEGDDLKWSYYESCPVVCNPSTGKCSSSANNDEISDNSEISDNGENSGNGGNSGGQTLVGADIFKAFDKVGNKFWYQWYLSGSYVGYNRKTHHYSSAHCRGWEVVKVSGDTATVNVYTDFDFEHPDIITFTRGSDGSLFMNGKQVTNTQTPEFYLMNFGKSGNYEWKELYNNGEYTNMFYTKSNGYTSTDNTIDITETWNAYGLAGAKESEFNNADAGSSTVTLTMKRAQTAYVSMGNDLSKPDNVNIEEILNITDSKYYYIQQNPTASSFMVRFTHNNKNAWGYGIGIYQNDDKGNAKCYPFYSLSDVHDYVKLNAFDDGAKDELGMPITDFDETTHYYTFFLTPKAVEWGNSAGQLYFCIFALGWGLDLVSDIDNAKAAFGINFKE